LLVQQLSGSQDPKISFRERAESRREERKRKKQRSHAAFEVRCERFRCENDFNLSFEASEHLPENFF
jgi:hypothetical protein